MLIDPDYHPENGAMTVQPQQQSQPQQSEVQKRTDNGDGEVVLIFQKLQLIVTHAD